MLAGLTDPTSLLSAQPPLMTPADAEHVTYEYFGVRASATLLESERDLNFRMAGSKGEMLLLKVTNASEDRTVTNLQTEALHHLKRRCPNLPVPHLVAARNGSDELLLTLANGMRHVTRLMTYLPGQPARNAQMSPALRRNISRGLAELDLGLRDFEHPAAKHELLWDVSRAGRIRPLIDDLADKDVRDLAKSFLEFYEADICPRLGDLPSQVIHNDFNPNNILVAADESSLTGIIDFGDMLFAPVVCDLATAAAYQLICVPDPLPALVEFTSCFNELLPLTVDDLNVLFDIVIARLVMIVVITEWRGRLHPTNRTYILRNTPAAAMCLSYLLSLSRSKALHALRRACRL
jgi:Ser/Thr protein kinase RdoA (MazF antagonist)